MSEIKAMKELMAIFCEDMQLLRASIDRIEAQVTPPAKDEGGWRDCLEWLKEIPGAPRLTKMRSINSYCGRDKMFKPGVAYYKQGHRRVFVRKGVEKCINKSIAHGN